MSKSQIMINQYPKLQANSLAILNSCELHGSYCYFDNSTVTSRLCISLIQSKYYKLNPKTNFGLTLPENLIYHFLRAVALKVATSPRINSFCLPDSSLVLMCTAKLDNTQ